MTYVLHRSLGDQIEIDGVGGTKVRLRLVAALADSILQGELVMSEENFLKVFPHQEGYRVLLVNAPPDRVDAVLSTVEDQLADFGADARPTGERLAEFHRVENTYLSTFQTLGGLGLLLGTIGLGAVLLRNVFERRQELALLGAVGYPRRHLFTIVIAESAFLLICGLVVGTVCALIAITPAAIERGGALPTGTSAFLLLLAVFATGLVSAVIATRVAIRARLLEALRAE
jgi:ABC-type antimicrobial peptide transport system permease subunit